MLLSSDQAAAFQREGFLVLPNVLTASDCQRLGAAIDDVLAELQAEGAAAGKAPEEVANHGVFVGLSLKREIFREVACDSRLVDPLESLWGPDVGFLSDKVVRKTAEIGFGSPWHQDWAYWQGSHKITIWIAVDEAREDNGCLLVVPGSHHQAIDHDRVTDAATGFSNRLDIGALGLDREPVSVPLGVGSAVMFHDLTLHASTPNTSGAPRRAYIATYRSLAEPDLDYPGLPAACRVRGTESSLAER